MTRIPFRKTLAFRLLLVSIILLSFPLLVDSFIIVQRSYKDALEDAKGYLVEVARQRALPLSEMQPVKRPFLVIMEQFLGLDEKFPTEPDKAIDETLKELKEVGEFDGIFLIKITPEGEYQVVGSDDPERQGKDYTKFFQLFDLFSPLTYNRGYADAIVYDSKTGVPYFVVGRVIFSKEEGTPIGVIVVAARVAEELADLLQPDKDKYPVYFALLLPDTVVYAASDPALIWHYFSPLSEKHRALLLEDEPLAKGILPEEPIETDDTMGHPFFEFQWGGKTQVGYLHKLPKGRLTLLTYASKEAIFAAPFEKFLDVYGIYALILIGGSLLAYLLTRWMGRPFRNLSHVMDQIDRGNLESRYHVDPVGYEINTLGVIFNEMTDTLIENKRRAEEERVKQEVYTQELLIGERVQRSLLPEKMPQYPGVELAEVFIPAKEVGGDFYDAYIKRRPEGDELILTIADASGKGVPACFYSLDVRGILRTYALAYHDVGKVMRETNHLFCEDTGDTGMFVTALMLVYNQQKKQLCYYSCGHNPPLLRRVDGTIEKLDHLGMALGLDPNASYTEERSIFLEKGDTLLFYTDGVTEAQDLNHHFYSEKRLISFLEKEGSTSPSELIEKLVEEIAAFTGEAPQHDDITALAMRVTEG